MMTEEDDYEIEMLQKMNKKCNVKLEDQKIVIEK